MAAIFAADLAGYSRLMSADETWSRCCRTLWLNTINFEDPEKVRHKINFDNLTPLYPDERLKLEIRHTPHSERTSLRLVARRKPRTCDWRSRCRAVLGTR
jgi:transcription termination factor Rho